MCGYYIHVTKLCSHTFHSVQMMVTQVLAMAWTRPFGIGHSLTNHFRPKLLGFMEIEGRSVAIERVSGVGIGQELGQE